MAANKMAFIQACSDGLIQTRWRGNYQNQKPNIPRQDWSGADIDLKTGRVIKANGEGMVFIDVCDDDLNTWLPPQNLHAKFGRKPSFDWVKIEKRIDELMDYHGDFDSTDKAWNAQARLEKIVTEEFEISVSTLRERLPKMLERWRIKKAAN